CHYFVRRATVNISRICPVLCPTAKFYCDNTCNFEVLSFLRRAAGRYILCSIAVLILSSQLPMVAHAQSNAPSSGSSRDPQALAILAQSVSTMGAIASPSRMTLAQGIITYPDGQRKPVTMKTLGTGYLRNDVGSGEFSFVSAGGRGFLLTNGTKHQ